MIRGAGRGRGSNSARCGFLHASRRRRFWRGDGEALGRTAFFWQRRYFLRFPLFTHHASPVVGRLWPCTGRFNRFWVWIDLWLLVVSGTLDLGSSLHKVLRCGIVQNPPVVRSRCLHPCPGHLQKSPCPAPGQPTSSPSKIRYKPDNQNAAKLNQFVLTAERSGSKAY